MEKKKKAYTVTLAETGRSKKTVIDPKLISVLLEKGLNQKEAFIKVRFANEHRSNFEAPLSWGEVRGSQIHIGFFKSVEVKRTPRPADEAMILLFAQNLGVIGFKAQGVKLSAKEAWLGLPEVLAQLQKRSEPRWIIPGAYEMTGYLTSPLRNSYRLADLSGAGLSFYITDAEARQFSKGLILREFRFSVRGKHYRFAAEVSGIAQKRVRLRFIRPDSKLQEDLRDFVLTQILQYE